MKCCFIHDSKANRILITALAERKLQSILVLSLITNTILMFRIASASFFITLFFASWNSPNPFSNPLERIRTCIYRWRSCGRSCAGAEQDSAREGVLAGWPFPSPHPEHMGFLHTQLVVCSLELGCNSNKIAEKAKCASINGILTFITTHSSCGWGKAPLNAWALFLLLNKICPGSVFGHWLLSISAA